MTGNSVDGIPVREETWNLPGFPTYRDRTWYAWRLAEVRQLRCPIVCTGGRRFWTAPEAVEREAALTIGAQDAQQLRFAFERAMQESYGGKANPLAGGA